MTTELQEFSRQWEQETRGTRALLQALPRDGYDAAARVARLETADLDREIRYADGELWSIRNLLWRKLLLHAVHHRGQLTVLCRLAGGVPPGLFGRTREEAAARRAAAATPQRQAPAFTPRLRLWGPRLNSPDRRIRATSALGARYVSEQILDPHQLSVVCHLALLYTAMWHEAP